MVDAYDAVSVQLYAGQGDSYEIQSAAVAPLAGKSGEGSWLDQKHPHWVRMEPRWRLVQDFYHGEPADSSLARKYLIRRFQGEADQAYAERVRTSDFTPWLGTIVDTLAGMLFAVEERATRVWTQDDEEGVAGSGLGDPHDPKTVAGRLVRDADGKGTSWKTVWRQCAIDLITYRQIWVLVDTVDGIPVVKLVNPLMVPNWIEGKNGITEALMCEESDLRTSLMQSSTEKTYVRWTLAGWERWTKDEDGTPRQLQPLTPYAYVDRQQRPTLPIFRIELPMRRYVTWLLAKKAMVIFNQESVRDFALRISSFAKLVLGVKTGNQYEQLINKILQGNNVYAEDPDNKGAHRYIAPPSDPVKIASEILKDKREDFWASGFKMYADAIKGREKTATEVKQDVAAGVGAFLGLLAAAVDDAENGSLWRLGQAEYKDTPDRWGVARVERSEDFSSVDLSAVLDQQKKRYFAGDDPIPVGRSALIKLAQEAAAYDGLPIDEDEIAAAVDVQQLKGLLGNMELLGITPAPVKVRLLMRLVTALGLVDAEETIDMSNGEKPKLWDVLFEQALELANLQEQTQRRMGELPPFSPAPPKGDKVNPQQQDTGGGTPPPPATEPSATAKAKKTKPGAPPKETP